MDGSERGSIGLVGAIAIGIGGMVGGGIFAVLGEAVSIAHGATPVAFLAGGIVALLTAASYARLAVHFPSRGGTVVYIDRAFGNNLLSGSLNLMLWLSYLVTIALYATAFGAYAQTLFGGHGATGKHLWISIAIVLPTLINIVSAQFVSRSETAIVALKLALIVVVVAASVPFVQLPRLGPVSAPAWLGAVPAGLVIFVAYEGFELIANAAEDVVRPRRNLPLAFFGSVLLVIVLYVLIAVITVGTVDEAELLRASDYVLAVAAEPALGRTGFVMVALAALLATFSAINATLYGNARLGYVLARDGELPRRFDREYRHTPVFGVLVTAALSLLLANLIDLANIAIIGSASFLLVFALVNASAWRLRRQLGGSAALYLAGAVACALALVALLAHTWQRHAAGVAVFAGFVVLSVLFEAGYGRVVRGHFMGRAYDGSASG